MKIISVRENPEYREYITHYIQSKWNCVLPIIYEDCINHCITTPNPLPQWYILKKEDEIVGCAGLITNDFISRMDLYPWVCALYIEENHRGNGYGSLLLDKAKEDALKAGFKNLYLCTEHRGYYEKYGFYYIGDGYHPWGDSSRIYETKLKKTTEKKANIKFSIRPEREKDHSEVYNLIQTAFRTAAVKDGDEQDFAVKLRESASYIAELALVAEYDNQLIGHIMFTKTYITQPDESKFEALLVAPLSVLLEYRNKGVGSALMKEGLRVAKALGYKAAFLCGNPAYYHRFSFKSVENFAIEPDHPIPLQYVLCYELEVDALKGINGIVKVS